MAIHYLRRYIKLETASGNILFAATILALIFANSPWNHIYEYILNTPLNFQIHAIDFSASLLTIINDGLMTVFFLLVSLEIKRELIEGELSTRQKATLPIVAALGGILLPALIYVFFNIHNTTALPGWAIPTATDIAFSLAILSLLKDRIPISLKIFLTALAIIDDLGAIIIIAIFYTHHIAYEFLLLSIACIGALILLNRCNITRLAPYMIVGLLLWICILQSGVHATIAGVILGLTIPLRAKSKLKYSSVITLEKKLHAWVAYGILPLFALSNAGLSFANISLATLFAPLPLGIICGLVIGKQLGIFGAGWLAIKAGIAKLPEKSNYAQFYGVAIICGIGFTMSLFIGTLAFEETEFNALVRLGVVVGSLLSGITGYLILRKTSS